MFGKNEHEQARRREIEGTVYKVEHDEKGSKIRANGTRRMGAGHVFSNAEIKHLTFLRKKGRAGS